MALKDWRKTRSGKDTIAYASKKYLEIIYIDFQYIEKNWFLSIMKNNKVHTKKQFKTKSQALKYARAYMRKH